VLFTYFLIFEHVENKPHSETPGMPDMVITVAVVGTVLGIIIILLGAVIVVMVRKVR